MAHRVSRPSVSRIPKAHFDESTPSSDPGDFGARLIEVCEQERHRIARELHDDLSQRLGLLCIDLDLLAMNRHTEGPEAAEARSTLIQRVRGLANELASDLHKIAVESHPERSIKRGLLQALRALCSDFSERSGLQIEFRTDRVPPRVAPDLALCVYRLVQEGLRNVLRHSHAHEANVEIAARGGSLEVHIADPGIGFAMSQLGSTSFGLLSMQERVHQLGGRMVVHSAPGAGTRIGVRLPLAAGPHVSTLAAAG
jgi:signal transduction histidine kinase